MKGNAANVEGGGESLLNSTDPMRSGKETREGTDANKKRYGGNLWGIGMVIEERKWHQGKKG